MKKTKSLTIREKRNWLADIFRDVNGEYSQAEKFKAMVEDTKLALIEEDAPKAKADTLDLDLDLFQHLPPPL